MSGYNLGAPLSSTDQANGHSDPPIVPRKDDHETLPNASSQINRTQPQQPQHTHEPSTDTNHDHHSQHGKFLPELPAAPPSHVVGQGYSHNHPVPTVQHYRETKVKQNAEAEEYARLVQQRQGEYADRDSSPTDVNRTARNVNGSRISDTQQVGDEETNVAKTSQGKSGGPMPHQGATEKQRMMDQMNSNKRECRFFSTYS